MNYFDSKDTEYFFYSK